MTPKANPLKLNPLQLKTLVLFQELARFRDTAVQGPGPGEITIQRFPNPHGDHFHMGDAVVEAKDASGLHNEAVWNALTRKGLARSDWPHGLVLTPEGLVYETGLRDQILKRGSGH